MTQEGDRLYGLGTIDMKGFAFIAMAVQEMDLRQLKKPLRILALADEEATMAGARAIAEAATIKPDYAVIGEPTGLVPVMMHKGHMSESIRVTGKSGHSSRCRSTLPTASPWIRGARRCWKRWTPSACPTACAAPSAARRRRRSTLVLGIVAIGLGILFEKQNIAFMVGLAFSIAASCNFPVLLFLSMFWSKYLTTRGAVYGHRQQTPI